MASAHLVLASGSPARLAILRGAGVAPSVVVSEVDEEDALAAARERFGELAPAEAVLALAQAKAEAVASSLLAQEAEADAIGVQVADSVLLGCDSMLEIDGEVRSKPGTPAEALRCWRQQRGRTGVLHTGHWLIDLRSPGRGGTGGTLGATSSTTVTFADLDDDEIAAYIATGEPLHVAGAFTIDGLGGPYIDRIEGDHHGVIGLSLPLLRELLAKMGLKFSHLRNP
ncbi:MAG: Maf family nucleotide pyrophosphatase [Promicromonosporaceae bacterium]|nr:Maf family nucleotide pyrophosphatase [Promicromonosporaceae bacterium]